MRSRRREKRRRDVRSTVAIVIEIAQHEPGSELRSLVVPSKLTVQPGFAAFSMDRSELEVERAQNPRYHGGVDDTLRGHRHDHREY